MTDLVSILIPAFNAEKWIGNAIESVLSQTWPNIEIIVVNDGSTDDTQSVINKYESKLLKPINQEHLGACAARNKALEFAQGDCIQWLDADDLLAPDKIWQQKLTMERCGSWRIPTTSAFGTFYHKISRAKFIPTSLWQDLYPIEWFLHKFNENVWLITTSWLVSREITEIAGLWDERLSLNDDGEYFCRIVAASEEIKFVESAKCFYRVGNTTSLSNQKSNGAYGSLLMSNKLCIDHMRKLEDSDRTTDACLKLLESLYRYSYNKTDKRFMEEILVIARELGGILNPRENLKFLVARKILGWERAVQIKNFLSDSDKKLRRNWDKILYTIFGM